MVLLCCSTAACEDPTFRDGVRCRPGTELRDNDGPPDLLRQWCAKPDGTKHGREVQWYSPGMLLECANENGARHGKITEWDTLGRKTREGEYTRGKPTGRWREWQYGAGDQNGALVGEWECIEGRVKRIRGPHPGPRCK